MRKTSDFNFIGVDGKDRTSNSDKNIVDTDKYEDDGAFSYSAAIPARMRRPSRIIIKRKEFSMQCAREALNKVG